jgi:glycine dehydrogenase subunit 2
MPPANSFNIEPLAFELSQPGRTGFSLPDDDVPAAPLPENQLRAQAPEGMPELSELDVIRHFTRLSEENYSIDSGFYPLGSCTMKYNPRIHEDVAILPGFAAIHPLQPEECAQGALEVMYGLKRCWRLSPAWTPSASSRCNRFQHGVDDKPTR